MSNKIPVGQRGYYSHIKPRAKPQPVKKGFSKWFWISIIVLIIIAIVGYVMFMYLQVILDTILGLIQGIIDFFSNLITF